ncbi:Uncharacterized protein ChrSV_0426 [Chromobacterium vaccinii]|nr:Uncharacterized protein ChrSW_0426 [Chromobacterium vaccinii]QND87885.1 Uncharacterized protein ChrSV_0426 [Chromobacterium vaccinii]
MLRKSHASHYPHCMATSRRARPAQAFGLRMPRRSKQLENQPLASVAKAAIIGCIPHRNCRASAQLSRCRATPRRSRA